ncbi:copper amine oxidase N-terminal domain-containing protein [Effusibacillus pohliae]|uniref:copper amine oxidase N-terminal domain-containing protein n=1 Tax=Effusibacillus pohliae TaxID=232270 RepID=UPI000360682A|nr:copper amine oxidase N-terminal domain-containing protein [Effusibacillus pohliae]
MKKKLVWTTALVMTLALSPAALIARAETATAISTATGSSVTSSATTTQSSTSTTTTTTTTTDPTTNPSQTSGSTQSSTTSSTTSGNQSDEEDDDGNGKNKQDDEEKDDQDHEHGGKGKGIKRALESLLKALQDGNGQASDDTLNAVIEKLIDKLKQDGLASSDDDAKNAVETQLDSEVNSGTATEDQVQVLVTLKLKDKKQDEAETAVEAALAKNPKSDKLYDLLSKVFQDKGDTEQVKVYVQGKRPNFDVQPFIKDGRTLIPVRAVSEALGADVKWNGETQTVTIRKGDITIELPIGSKTIKVNGQTATIDVPAQIADSRTVVPVRFISEFLGHQVQWDANAKMVIVK